MTFSLIIPTFLRESLAIRYVVPVFCPTYNLPDVLVPYPSLSSNTATSGFNDSNVRPVGLYDDSPNNVKPTIPLTSSRLISITSFCLTAVSRTPFSRMIVS